jgi:MSHA pilin protein MshC
MKKNPNMFNAVSSGSFPGTITGLSSEKRKGGIASRASLRKNAGFTLLEVVMVLIIAGIVGVIVVTRFIDTSADLTAQTDVVKTHLRYAQTRAMSSNVIWGVEFQGTTYSLFRNGNTGDTVYFPGEGSLTLDLPSGTSANEIVSFDSWGKPFNNAAATSDHPGGQIGNLSITITANTGFVE